MIFDFFWSVFSLSIATGEAVGEAAADLVDEVSVVEVDEEETVVEDLVVVVAIATVVVAAAGFLATRL